MLVVKYLTIYLFNYLVFIYIYCIFLIARLLHLNRINSSFSNNLPL